MTDGTLLITVGDKTIGIRFGMQAVLAISAEGLFDDAKDGGTSDKAFVTASSITKMAYHGYLNWCLYMDEKGMTRGAFIDYMDEAFISNNALLNDIVSCFEKSRSVAGLKEEKKTKGGKK